MLLNLHVKNFAIIDEIDVDFNKHLNILTGETGAGKSILVGSINIALGARVSAEMIRKGADYAIVELVFQIEREETIQKLMEWDIVPEQGQIIITRRIVDGKSINKINGESVSVSTIRKVAELCIDIHGQHEHQSLLRQEHHIEILDEYLKKELQPLLAEYRKTYHEYTKLKAEWNHSSMPEEDREHQVSFMEFEANEIQAANLVENEEEELAEQWKKYQYAEKIGQAVNQVYQLTEQTAGEAISHAIQELDAVVEYDDTLNELSQPLRDVEGILGDFNRELSRYLGDFDFDQNDFDEITKRLSEVRRMYSRYGGDYASVMEHLTQIHQKLEKFHDYDIYMDKMREQIQAHEKTLSKLANQISTIRKKGAKTLQTSIMEALADLNFEGAEFEICIQNKNDFTAMGKDEVEFLIATNPGEDKKPLVKIASGGELSRIMLALKSVFADSDAIETLIFDEIDVGISGRTAQKVSEKMVRIGQHHQVICITHLAQIAAMADTHYCIEKKVENGKTKTVIQPLNASESIEELARILGGAEITEAVRNSAREMKELAAKVRQETFTK